MTTIIITGASNGIGAALARYYAAPGVKLGLTGRDHARLDDVARDCRKRGALVQADIIDVADRDLMAAWLTRFDTSFPVDLLIVNAGIGNGGGKAPTPESLRDARTMFAVNIDGVCNTIDPILPRMAQRGRGQVAMMASLAAFRGLAGAPAYGASKGFVKLYGEGLRGACAAYGIQVNVICPGFVESGITARNKFRMPMFMKADKAAAIIAQGLQKNRARIAFPWPMVFASWLFAALPVALSDWIATRLPQKD